MMIVLTAYACQHTEKLVTPSKQFEMTYTMNQLIQEEQGDTIHYFAFEFLDLEEPMLVFNVDGKIVIYDEYFEEARKIRVDEEPLFEYYRNLDGVMFQPVMVDETIYNAVTGCLK